ncbi:DUF6286 domain-containing protein [Arthrobacter sp. NPDC056691]|uniref:DUF6286 domain-containing protein n=1 Tax=Arthrobacter sp. NPDC056691 TaxID=3345913 RepID=UPI00366D3D2C
MSSVVEQQHEAGGDPAQDGTGAAHAATIDMRSVLHRETHASRAVASVIAGSLVIVLCLYALLESAVRAIGQPPWLIDPQTAAERIVALPSGVPPLLLGAAGAVTAAVGLFFFLSAVLPGRRARHLLADRRIAVVVDDEVIAAALARSARLAANVTQAQVMVVVSQRQVVVNVRPTSGVPVSENDILQAVEDELQAMGPAPMPQVTVNLSTSGVVGA